MPLRSMVHGFRVQSTNNQEVVPFFTPDVQETPQTFSSKSLLVPIVSAANVPQLAVDILITSLSLPRIGTFDSKYLVPVVGGREGGSDGVTTPMELFGKGDIDFVIIQQRSPVLKSQKDKFISSLLQFAQESGFKSVLFLSGLDLTNRTDSQMFTPIYQLVPTASPLLSSSPLASLNTLPEYKSATSPDSGPSFSGGGLTRRIFSSIPNGWTIPTGFLLIFALEGDNRADAAVFAGVTARIVTPSGNIEEWKEPESWKQGLFGPAHDQIIRGVREIVNKPAYVSGHPLTSTILASSLKFLVQRY